MGLSKTFLAKVTTITRTCENPEVIAEAMKCTMTKTVKKIHSIYIRDMFDSLLHKKLATREVHVLAKKLCKTIKGKHYTEIINIIHIDDLNGKRDRLWKHCQNEHGGERQEFRMSILNTCRNDPTKRQIMESIYIQNTDPSVTMNERAEWNGVTVPRIRIE